MNVRARLLVAAIAILAAFATTARADDREDAKREFAAGQAADKQKDWQAALEHYLAAYDKLAHPFALYNIGNDYEQLGNFREAAHFYQRYLDASPDPAEREKVTRMLADLRLRPSKLVVHTAPEGSARVTIDNNVVGSTPYSGSIRGGKHHIIVEHEGQRQEQDVTAEYGEPLDVPFKLAGATGTLLVRGTPSGALVTVDELAAGVTPVSVPVTPGQHQVRVTQYGFAPFEQTAIVTPGMVTEIDAQLVPGTGPNGTGGPMIQVGYLFGFDGGADIRGSGALFEVELGFRIASYEGVVGFGKAGGSSAVDLGLRWNITKSALKPFLGAAYSFVENGGGYEISGGLRYDFSRTQTYGFSILATVAARYFSGSASDPMGNTVSTNGVLVPIFLSLVATKFR